MGKFTLFGQQRRFGNYDYGRTMVGRYVVVGVCVYTRGLVSEVVSRWVDSTSGTSHPSSSASLLFNWFGPWVGFVSRGHPTWD